VLVHRTTEHQELVARHGTRQQAAFFLEARGRTLQQVVVRHEAQVQALDQVGAAVPVDWRRVVVERADLARFVFGPEDVVVVVGQDGLVANVAKYLDGQPVVGIDPEPGTNAGVLVQHAPTHAGTLIRLAVMPDPPVQERTMVEATTDDGQRLCALNEIYVGHRSHQSSRYRLQLPDGRSERQSSSGVLVGTGTGGTGWLRSAWQERHCRWALPEATDGELCWFVREAWPSPATGTELAEGVLPAGESLALSVESDELVCFGDGIEADAVRLTWGQQVTVRAASQRLRLVD
jgi:hypothetical protein